MLNPHKATAQCQGTTLALPHLQKHWTLLAGSPHQLGLPYQMIPVLALIVSLNPAPHNLLGSKLAPRESALQPVRPEEEMFSFMLVS